jgi:hypothetical protein
MRYSESCARDGRWRGGRRKEEVDEKNEKHEKEEEKETNEEEKKMGGWLERSRTTDVETDKHVSWEHSRRASFAYTGTMPMPGACRQKR